MQTTEPDLIVTWMPPDDACAIAKRLYGIKAGRDRTCKAMPQGTVKWGPRSRGEGRANPLDIRPVEVLFGDYLRAARALDDDDRKAQPTPAKQTLEARVAALEAAFDALLSTTKELAE